MIGMPILSLHYLSTSIKGHNDISVKSYALPVFFPRGFKVTFLCCCTLLSVHITFPLHHPTQGQLACAIIIQPAGYAQLFYERG